MPERSQEPTPPASETDGAAPLRGTILPASGWWLRIRHHDPDSMDPEEPIVGWLVDDAGRGIALVSLGDGTVGPLQLEPDAEVFHPQSEYPIH